MPGALFVGSSELPRAHLCLRQRSFVGRSNRLADAGCQGSVPPTRCWRNHPSYQSNSRVGKWGRRPYAPPTTTARLGSLLARPQARGLCVLIGTGAGAAFSRKWARGSKEWLVTSQVALEYPWERI